VSAANPKVLLIKSFSLVSKVSGVSPPLGVMSLAAYLREKAGADVRILDLKFLPKPLAAVRDAVQSLSPDLVGISALTAEARVMHRVAQDVRAVAPGVLLVAGGPHPTAFPEDTLAPGHIDAAVLGEGEETLLELAQRAAEDGHAARSQECLRQIRGIAFSPHSVRTPRRPFIQDLDALPFPAWDLVNLEPYWKRGSMASIGHRPYMAIFTSRGCPFRCSYCHNLFGKQFRARSPASVVEEISRIGKSLGVRDIEWFDDIANLDRKRMNGILEGLLQRDMHPRLSFPNALRTDLLGEDTVDLLKKVGTGEISIAVESACDRIQRLVGKHLDLEKVRTNIDRLTRRRIFTRGFFMLGFPTETEAEIRQTIDFASSSSLHLALFFAVNPFAGTRIRQQFLEADRLAPDTTTIDYEYFGAPFNGSTVDDATFRNLYRTAYARFYANPVRMARIARDRPYKMDIPARVAALLTRVVSFRRLTERAECLE
jgi:radical SAM superfamily enzyme YgiQ (UPF0313 family)